MNDNWLCLTEKYHLILFWDSRSNAAWAVHIVRDRETYWQRSNPLINKTVCCLKFNPTRAGIVHEGWPKKNTHTASLTPEKFILQSIFLAILHKKALILLPFCLCKPSGANLRTISAKCFPMEKWIKKLRWHIYLFRQFYFSALEKIHCRIKVRSGMSDHRPTTFSCLSCTRSEKIR